MGFSCKVHKEQGGDTLSVESGGAIDVKTGGKVKANGTQASHIADASVAHSLNATFSNTEAQNALNALGGKINSIFDALEGAGILAAS